MQRIYQTKYDSNSIAPVWQEILGQGRLQEIKAGNYDILRDEDVKKLITPAWLSGFTEADGSFYLTKKQGLTGNKLHSNQSVNSGDGEPSEFAKGNNCDTLSNARICHGYGITQSGNRLVLEAIRIRLGIKAKVKKKTSNKAYVALSTLTSCSDISIWALDTTNRRSVQNLIEMLSGQLKGMKSVEFRIWQRAFNDRGNSAKLMKVQEQMRKLRSARLRLKIS